MGYYTTESYDCERSIGYLLRRAATLTLAQLEIAFAKADITFSQWVVLMQVRAGIAQTASDITRNTGHDSGALTRLIDQLEAHGFIERRRSQDDRRSVKLHVTDAGDLMAEALTPIVFGFHNTILEGFTVGEADTLIALLQKLVVNASGVHLSPEEQRTAPEVLP